MKLIVVGDLHFKNNNIDETDAFESAFFRFVEARTGLTVSPFPLAVPVPAGSSCFAGGPLVGPLVGPGGVNGIVFLGDILDKHDRISGEVQSRVVRFFDKIIKMGIEIYIIVGNHDLRDNNVFLSNTHSLSPFRNWSMTHVIDYPRSFIIEGQKVTMLPFVPKGRFHEALTHAPGFEDSKYIFCHQEFAGAQMGAKVSEDGDPWPSDYPKVISGHIHDHQVLSNNLMYLGVPYQDKFGESDKCILYIDNDELEFIELEGTIKKMIQVIDYSDLDSYVAPDDPLLKLKIRIKITDPIQRNMIKVHPTVINLLKRNYVIEPVETFTTRSCISFVNHQNIGFKEHFFNKLKNEGLYDLFASEFN